MRISQQAKQEKRKRILEVAAKLFIQEGFEVVTIRQIAKEMGMATGTLFNYFPSKESLAMNMVTDALSKAQDDFVKRRVGDEDLNETLYLFISCGLRRLKPYRPFLGPVLEHSLSPFPRINNCVEGETSKQLHLGMVQKLIEQHGLIAPSEHVILSIYWSLYLGILAFWLNDSSAQQQQTQAMIDYSLNMFVHSIYGPHATPVEKHKAKP